MGVPLHYIPSTEIKSNASNPINFFVLRPRFNPENNASANVKKILS